MDAKLSILTETFKNCFAPERFLRFTAEFFGGLKTISPDRENTNIPKEYQWTVASYRHIATYTTDGETLDVFAVKLQSGKGRTVERARSMQRSFISKLLTNSNHDAAVVAFYTDDDPRWRLSFIRLDYEFAAGRVQMSITPAKRYSYLVGENEPCHTAMAQLYPIFRDEDFNPSLDRIEEAFSVERVTKDFFEQYKDKYFILKDHLENSDAFNEEAARCKFTSEQFAKKLMGQLAFLYFLQKKGWLGVRVLPSVLTEKEYKNVYYRSRASREIIPQLYQAAGADEYKLNAIALKSLTDEDADIAAGCFKADEWGKGEKAFVRHLFTACKTRNFFDEYLEPLFYEALNHRRGTTNFYKRFNCKIPFLNGGLFEPLEGYDWSHNQFDIPNDIFSNITTKGERDADGIPDIFDRYNFTMNEDEPLEREVAVDPEMLGKIFENLLDAKDRKSKGAFYTPREIVHYMCAESLANYLVGKTGTPYDDMKAFIVDGEFMKDEDYNNRSTRRLPQTVFDKLREIDKALETIRVADPAVGSGAFPLGMLSEIVKARNNITYYYAAMLTTAEERARIFEQRDPYTLKWQTIQNCIFAVDIEASAVDIAKLRLWLSLVVDEDLSPTYDDIRWGEAKQKDPRPLPNLDYNIMCGNSLIDEFEGIQLFDDTLLSKDKADMTGTQMTLQMSLYVDSMDVYLEDLRREQERLFGEENQENKSKIKQNIDKIIDNIIRAKLGRDKNADGLWKYEESLKQKTKPYFLWKLEFARVFRENGGFDVVIGNPPYVGERKHKNVFEAVQKSSFNKYYLGRMDFFYFFFHLALDIMKDASICSLITTNYFISAMGGKTLRTDLKKRATIISMINFNECKVFDSAAGQHNMITTFCKGNTDRKAYNLAVKISGLPETSQLMGILQNGDFSDVTFVEQKDLWDGSENYLRVIGVKNDSSPINSILDKIVSMSSDILGNICKPLIGLESSLDSVYVLSAEQISEITSGNDNELKHVKMFFKNSDIGRYYLKENSDKYILYLHENIKNITELVGIYSYLCQYEKEIKGRKGANLNGAYRRGNWWVLNTPRLDMDFNDEKIVTPYRTRTLRFALSTNPWYASRDVYYITKSKPNISLKYILALLNSKLYYIWYYHRGKRKGDMLELYAKPLKETPIIEVNAAIQEKFTQVVDRILLIKGNNSSTDTAALEAEIDRMVYKLYGLTEDEIAIVEGAGK